MPLIPFTNYVLPNGRREQIEHHVPADLYHKAQSLISLGYVFESETLRNGAVSLTCEKEEDTAGMELVFNPEFLNISIESLINDAHATVFPPSGPAH